MDRILLCDGFIAGYKTNQNPKDQKITILRAMHRKIKIIILKLSNDFSSENQNIE